MPLSGLSGCFSAACLGGLFMGGSELQGAGSVQAVADTHIDCNGRDTFEGEVLMHRPMLSDLKAYFAT